MPLKKQLLEGSFHLNHVQLNIVLSIEVKHVSSLVCLHKCCSPNYPKKFKSGLKAVGQMYENLSFFIKAFEHILSLPERGN